MQWYNGMNLTKTVMDCSFLPVFQSADQKTSRITSESMYQTKQNQTEYQQEISNDLTALITLIIWL